MPAPTRSTSLVAIDRPDRYGKQLVTHLSRRYGGEWSADGGTGWIQLQGGRATVVARETALELAVESETADLEALQDVVASHLIRFADPQEIAVSWIRDGPESTI